MKTKIKSHGHEVTDYYDKKIPRVNPNHACLTVISLDSAPEKDTSYCPHVKNKVIRQTNDNLSDFFPSDESDDE